VSDDKIIKLHSGKVSKDPDHMLEMAKGDFKELCILGVNSEGRIEARATKDMTISTLLFLLENIKFTLIAHGYFDEDDDDE